MWKKIRGCGLSYGYELSANVDQGRLNLGLTKSTHPFKAFKAAKEIIETTLAPDFKWNKNEFESAKSSLIFESVEKFDSISGVVQETLLQMLRGTNKDTFQ